MYLLFFQKATPCFRRWFRVNCRKWAKVSCQTQRTLRNNMHENREISSTPWSEDQGRSAKAINQSADMHVLEKSDRAVVPVNQPNKGVEASAEVGEGSRRKCCGSACGLDSLMPSSMAGGWAGP
jgi:hypothetical protein